MARAVLPFALVVLAATPAGAQQVDTTCSQISRFTYCNSTVAPAPNQALIQSETNFGAALGAAIAAARERRAEERAAKAAQDASLQAQISAFAADPTHPYFGIVRGDMGDIIRAGKATTLEQAYQMAIAESPQVRLLTAPAAPATAPVAQERH